MRRAVHANTVTLILISVVAAMFGCGEIFDTKIQKRKDRQPRDARTMDTLDTTVVPGNQEALPPSAEGTSSRPLSSRLTE